MGRNRQDEIDSFRKATESIMTCACGGRMFIVTSGITCEHAHGKIIDPGVGRSQLVEAWPERVHVGASVAASRQTRAINAARKSDPTLFDKGGSEPERYT